jgi:hypothetical protein
MINLWHDRGITGGNFRLVFNIIVCLGCEQAANDPVCFKNANGTEHLTHIGLRSDYDFIWINVSILLGMGCIVRAIALVALFIRNRMTDG